MYKLIEFLRRIYVAVLFVVFEAIAIGYYAHSSNYTQAKLLTRSNQVVGGVNGIFADIRSYFTLGRENERLLERVAVLEEELAFYRRSAADSVRTDLLHDMGEKPYELTVARVISNSINKNRNFIVLDRGERDGVEKGMGVLSPEGAMVGYVAASSDRHAVAVSILNTSFNASGKLAGDDYFGSIYWAGDDRYHVRMKELSKYARVTEGEEVVSSGFSQYFPADVLIGYVESFSLRYPDGLRRGDPAGGGCVATDGCYPGAQPGYRRCAGARSRSRAAKQKINMYRTVPYIVLFLILALLQIFLFDNLSISIYLCPLVYIGFIVLLPIDAPPVAVLFLALSMSVAMDWAMGAAGINTIATLPVAMLRRPLLQSVCGKEGIREGGIPSSIRLGQGGFLRYLAAMVVVHHFLFFMLESLSWAQLFHTLVRLVVSSAVTVGFIWLLARLFTTKLTVRL